MPTLSLFGAVCLVAGTTIGAGMLALPLTIASLGVGLGALVLVIMWYAMYQASLITLELTLRYGRGVNLGTLGLHFSGKMAQIMGVGCTALLAYALLSAYLFGGGSLIQSFLMDGFNYSASFLSVLSFIALGLTFILGACGTWIDKANRLLFFVMIGAFVVLIFALLPKIDQAVFVFYPPSALALSSWKTAIPILFTSFGFHLMIGNMVNYCDKNIIVIKRCFFWGSFIPLAVYLIWIISSLGVLFKYDPQAYSVLMENKADVGFLIEKLSQNSSYFWVEQCRWVVALVAILTSALGVGLPLVDMWKEYLPFKSMKTAAALILTFVPPFFVAFFIPHAFIKALGVSGLILAIISILLPAYLLKRSDNQKKFSFENEGIYVPRVKKTIFKIICWGTGGLVVGIELLNLLFS